jgi:hypothetical protein
LLLLHDSIPQAMKLTRPLLFAFILLSGKVLWAAPQKCPTETTDVSTSITGQFEYHPGVYGWYGLRPAQPICGQRVIQLGLDNNTAFRQAHRFVGCQVTATGNLFVPDTGYWSTSLGMTHAHIQPGNACKPGQALPDYSAVPIPSALQRYKVIANYDPKTEIFSAKVYEAASDKPLTPWQRYATDSGNGGRDLQRMFCAADFLASNPVVVIPHGLQVDVDLDLPQAVDVVLENDSSVHVSFTCARAVTERN